MNSCITALLMLSIVLAFEKWKPVTFNRIDDLVVSTR